MMLEKQYKYLLYTYALIISVSLLSSQVFAKSKVSMVTIGDSISAAFNAVHFGDNRNYSWSSGRQLNSSIINHLEATLQNRVDVYNIATMGAEVSHLMAQASRIQNLSPDIVTILIGGNDLCHYHDGFQEHRESFKKSLRQVIDMLIKANSDVKIIIAELPDFEILGEIANKNPSCMKKWKHLNICQSVLSESNIARQFPVLLQNISSLNHDINQVVREHPQRSKITLVTGMDQVKVSADIISNYDCFHPNRIGQEKIASYINQFLKQKGFYDDIKSN